MIPCIVGNLNSLHSHPNCDSMDVGQIVEHTVVLNKCYEESQLGFFIPDGAIVPDRLLVEMNLYDFDRGRGTLSGRRGNRVQTRIIHGIRSEGLFYGAYYFENGRKIDNPSWNEEWTEGQDVSLEVGIW